ncbi:MAG: hypothetical protein ABIZ91_08140 [Gemmatimonadaceae bacterium]
MASGHTGASARIGIAIGAVMVGLGAYIAARTLFMDGAPVTGQRWLDLAFAFFFIVRGAMQYARWRRGNAAPPS